MNEPKNPYRALAEILRALPEDRHLLLKGRLNGPLSDELGTRCGCVFGTTYPRVVDLIGHNDVSRIDWWGGAGRDQAPLGLQEVSRTFADWLRDLGAPPGFAEEVMAANDAFGGLYRDNTRTDAETRYCQMINWLDKRAARFDAMSKT